MPSEETAVLALMLCPGIGNVSVNEARAAAQVASQSLSDLVCRRSQELVDILPEGQGNAIYTLGRCDRSHLRKAETLLKRVRQAGGTVALEGARDYPRALRTHLGTSAPPILFVLGNADLLDTLNGAVVGARDATSEGLRLAGECARAFASENIPVVSGGARGVDLMAHETTLVYGGSTLLILPQGLLTYCPSKVVSGGLDDDRAVVVSEFSPELEWATHAAVTRNATISALAHLVCVIEPGKQGGSMRTARCALGQGKRVLVHGRSGDASPAMSLQRAGALSLFDRDDVVLADRLAEQWAAPRRSLPEQSTLL